MRKQEKIGYGLVARSLLLVVLGSIGFTSTGEITDLPTPNVPEKTFFGDEPIPENGFSTFITAELTLTWDRIVIRVQCGLPCRFPKGWRGYPRNL